jgi:uncharacterized protein (DUF342 family)
MKQFDQLFQSILSTHEALVNSTILSKLLMGIEEVEDLRQEANGRLQALTNELSTVRDECQQLQQQIIHANQQRQHDQDVHQAERKMLYSLLEKEKRRNYRSQERIKLKQGSR